MQEIKTYADITRAANAMKREREIERELDQHSMLPDPAQFERVFQEIFAGDEVVKPKRTDQELIDHGHSIHDF